MHPRPPPPKFSSFSPPVSSSAAAPRHNHRSSVSGGGRLPHDSPYDTASQESPLGAGEHIDRPNVEKKRHKEKSRRGSKRRDELRAMDVIATRPTRSQLENRSRRPSQFTLEDSGISFYDDPYGESGSLFLEVKYWPSSQVRQVLGVSPPLRVLRDVKQRVFEVHIPYHFRTRNNVIRQFKAAGRARARRLTMPQSGVIKGEVDGFIPVGKPRNTAPNTADPPEYRSLTLPKDTDTDSSDSDSGGIEDIDSDDEDTTDAYSAETARLARILQEDMSSVPAWLDVISHSASSNPTAQGRADIWLTMLDRAMSAHPRNRQSDILRLRYLEAMRDTKASEEEEAAWEQALLEIQSENLWVEYISHRLEKHGPESLENAVIRIWRELSGANFGTDRKHRTQLRVFWRAVTGLKEAGYLERATAAVQAQVELSYFVPDSLKSSSLSEILDSLEAFWDSEMPRIGEIGARGWSSSASQPLDVIPTESDFVPASSSTYLQYGRDADGYQRWAAAEDRIDASEWLPQRDRPDDPYSAVLFSDIRPFLFSPVPGSSGLAVLLMFLHILGLPIPGFSESLTDDGNREDDSTWSYVPFMTKPNLLGSLFAIDSSRTELASPIRDQKSDSVGLVNELIAGKERRMGRGWGSVKSWALGTRPLLEGYGPHGEGRMWEQADLECVDVEFIRRVFQCVDIHIKSEEWAEYWIAFEAAANIKEAIKLSKTILASYPDSLRLWSAHASLQRIRRKPDAARKVYETCLMNKATPASWLTPSDHQTDERARMWWSWAEMEWIHGAYSLSTRVLCAAVDVTVSQDATDTRIALLRSRRAYDNVLRAGGVAIGVKASLLQCFALLELIHSHDSARALASFADYKDILGTGSPDSREICVISERLAVASALLIYHHTHTLKNICRPVVLRKHVCSLIPDFPGNSLLLGVWLESERGEAVWGRVRKGVAEVVLQGGGSTAGSRSSRVSVARWAWAVWVETWERGAWNADRARSILRQALEDSRLRRSPTLWMMLISLEARLGSKIAAHNLVYQATAACPWVKGFYMYAFAISRPQFSAEELRHAVNTMAERAIRLRAAHSLESYLVNQDSGADEESDGGWGEVEIEHGASELARLRPY